MIDLIPPGKDWTDVFTALITPSIWIIGIIIAVHQLRINRNRLKHELFDRRYEKFEIISKFLGGVLRHGKVQPGADLQFRNDVNGIQFIFGDRGDKAKSYTEEIYKKAVLMHTVVASIDSATGGRRTELVENQGQLMRWFAEQSNSLEEHFKEDLTLRDL